MVASRNPVLVLAAAVLATGCTPRAGTGPAEPAPTSTTAPASTTASAATPPSSSATPSRAGAVPAEDLDDPASLAVVVNKRRPVVPQDWAPPALEDVEGQLLRPEAADAARAMLAAARADGVPLRLVSGYRSYAEQAAAYGHWVAQKGAEAADTASARPGHSEHQTGLAVDVGDGSGCELRVCFAETPAAEWVARHGPEHGFVVRYPWGEHPTTGYWYEPWHLRYLGPGRAQEFVASGATTLEEFSGLGPAPDYGASAPG